MHFRLPTVVGVIAFCVAISMLITTVDNRIFRRGKKSSTATPAFPSPQAGTSGIISPFEPIDIRDQHWEANQLLTKAADDIEEALRLSNLWPETVEKMQTSDVGEAILVEEDLVNKIAFLDRQERISSDEIGSYGERVGDFQKRIGELSKLSTPRPLSAREMSDIRELQFASESARLKWSQAHEQADAIERVAIDIMMPKRNPSLEDVMRSANDQALVEDIQQEQEYAEQEKADRREREKALAEQQREKELARLHLEERATSAEVTSFLALT